ncbi:MAG: pseudouridine synthase [Lachnospiraceae bacterium]
MKDNIRLDKFLADMSVGTRSQVKAIIGKGRIKVNGTVVKDSAFKIDTAKDSVVLDEKKIYYKSYEYYMLNKPAGVISATIDESQKTVLELITEKSRKDLFPVGRLDKDTEGLLLITNNGELSHRLLSPGMHVDKTYYVETDKAIDKNGVYNLENGIDIGEDKLTMPARLKILSTGNKNAYLLTICEGKFHQVKRMFQAAGANVIYLKRLSMGKLKLDEKLKPGEYRTLTEEEIKSLTDSCN